ncbi:hypothetical protein KC19_1G333300 [Ceratodon purpureus]|uniref:glutamate--cysteine ligase n=1 Tax=Ceratodon purpureus TaxID=3225 RepID=A0A8T0JFP0_CERPU|nr:hypothetical protein KC19_1G333300 [Ceratodon purpureus]
MPLQMFCWQIATAIFANSPFTEGKPNGYLSYRSHIWTDVDNNRSGDLPFVFEDGFGYVKIRFLFEMQFFITQLYVKN